MYKHQIQFPKVLFKIRGSSTSRRLENVKIAVRKTSIDNFEILHAENEVLKLNLLGSPEIKKLGIPNTSLITNLTSIALY